MLKVVIFRPHLGIPFKKSPPMPNNEDNLPPIRQHWKDFLDKLIFYFKNLAEGQYDVTVVDGPLWMMNKEVLEQLKPDIAFIPHKNKAQYGYEAYGLYAMQSVFPWLFTINDMGWGKQSSEYPFSPEHGNPESPAFDQLRERALNNLSKFDQPAGIDIDLPDNFALFPCQLPHDETIKYNSPVSVEHSLHAACEWSKRNKIPLVVKGHPANPQSMSPLQQIVALYPDNVIWTWNSSIHELIAKSDGVFTINSGVGFESLLHRKPVITFGWAEYDCITTHSTLDDLDRAWEEKSFNEMKTRQFCDAFVNYYCVDANNIDSFKHIEDKWLNNEILSQKMNLKS